VSNPAFADPAVAVAFERYPEPIRSRLLALRQLIFETAAATAGVGPLQETLKWGQPAYLTPETRAGSTIRIDRVAGSDDVALYCHCQTDLISVFRELYPQRFRYQGNRALVLDKDRAGAAEPLRHCIALALTYHLRRKAVRAQSAACGTKTS
jgi:Domain of unknown function (DU1801)